MVLGAAVASTISRIGSILQARRKVRSVLASFSRPLHVTLPEALLVLNQEEAQNLLPDRICPPPLDEKFLIALCNGLVEAVFVIEIESRCIVHWNKGAEALFKYRIDEMLRETADRLFADPSAADRYYGAAVHETEAKGFWRGEWEYRRRDGSRFIGEASATLLRTGGKRYMTVVVRESTEQRRIRERLKDKEHMAAVGTATAMLAHEIKNPLNGMSTTVQLLERSLRNDSPPSKEIMIDTVQDLKNEIGRLQSLLADFQAISHPQRLNFQPVELAQLMRELTSLVVPESPKQKIRIVEDYAADLPLVHADPDKLKQAFINLIKNACEAMPNGGALTTKAYHTGEDVTVEIIDTGQGIPPGLDIFQLFSSTKSDGTGLGLVIVRQIILAHNGSIEYSSEPGAGTTFRVTLPLHPQ
jgi:PAS domain S-box-containing protein